VRRPAGFWPETLLGLIVGAVFVYASVDKILHPGNFARIIYRYHLVGPNSMVGPILANVVAVTLPWVELLVGLSLILGPWRREASLLAGALLLSFVLAVSSTLVRGIDVENCGCFTVQAQGGRRAGYGLIVADLALLGMALAILRRRGAHGPVERPATST
jgi:uncharacterized membrane protein YphA (DoxX/SURF4 family)